MTAQAQKVLPLCFAGDMFAARAMTGSAADTEFREFMVFLIETCRVTAVALARQRRFVPAIRFIGDPFAGGDQPFCREEVIFVINHSCIGLFPFIANHELDVFLAEHELWRFLAEIADDVPVMPDRTEYVRAQGFFVPCAVLGFMAAFAGFRTDIMVFIDILMDEKSAGKNRIIRARQYETVLFIKCWY